MFSKCNRIGNPGKVEMEINTDFLYAVEKE